MELGQIPDRIKMAAQSYIDFFMEGTFGVTFQEVKCFQKDFYAQQNCSITSGKEN